MANIYGIDLGTCNIKIFSKHSNKIIKEKNTIAVINKNQLYAYGDEEYQCIIPGYRRSDRRL